MTASTIRVFLVDDHQLVLDSLCARLSQFPDFELVGTASSATDALPHLVTTQPDIVALDVELPGRGAFDLALELKTRCPATKVVFLTGFASDVLIEQALRVQASGYVLKGDSSQTLLDAFREVARGNFYFSEQIRDRVRFDSTLKRHCLSEQHPLNGLTPRQIEVLRHLARGESVKEVARIMHLSQKSVDSHKYRIMNKLGIHDRVLLARYAIREGLTLP